VRGGARPRDFSKSLPVHRTAPHGFTGLGPKTAKNEINLTACGAGRGLRIGAGRAGPAQP